MSETSFVGDREDGGGWWVRFWCYYNRGCAGMPDRSWVRKTLSLTENQWGQIVYNGRFVGASWDGRWWYEKMVVNVGLFDQLTADLFTRETPTYRFSAMGDLF